MKYAVYSSTLGGYLSALAAVTDTAVWQTSSTWSTITVSNLTCNTNYSFSVIGRNVSSVETATSSVSTVTTSACPVVVVSGGGGSVGGGGSMGTIQTVFNTPAVPAPSNPVPNPTPIPAPTSNPTTSPSPEPAISLDHFIQEGGSPSSHALGQGERQAIIRDFQEILGRSVNDLPVSDLERMASGQIPLTRNLAYERTMVPRALTTFRTLYGHSPVFSNPEENLAWNTLVNRIRFPRDLTLEQTGITEFRRTFHTVPRTPFQWSVVRVMGYVQR